MQSPTLFVKGRDRALALNAEFLNIAAGTAFEIAPAPRWCVATKLGDGLVYYLTTCNTPNAKEISPLVSIAQHQAVYWRDKDKAVEALKYLQVLDGISNTRHFKRAYLVMLPEPQYN